MLFLRMNILKTPKNIIHNYKKHETHLKMHFFETIMILKIAVLKLRFRKFEFEHLILKI